MDRLLHQVRSVAIALTVIIGATGCSAATPALTDEFYEVSGRIESADGADRTCFLSVYASAGFAVGETAQVVQPSEQFRWTLREGKYRLEAACDDASGELIVEVPVDDELQIVVG